jgi:hypothetical protein
MPPLQDCEDAEGPVPQVQVTDTFKLIGIAEGGNNEM